MKANTLRQKYLNFFQKKQHQILPSAPIVPENDPSTLFTGSGMQPLINYFLGAKHPQGTRVTNSQRCFRSQDIEDVGDNRHITFFEMLGNWSFGDYFKKEQLAWFFEFLTDELGIDPQRLYVTIYRGDKNLTIASDNKSQAIWQQLFAQKNISAKVVETPEQQGLVEQGKIFQYGSDNWWSRAGAPDKMPVGEPGGPDSEVFYDFGAELKLHENSPFKDQICHPNCDCGRFLEIGNSVFMQFQKTATGVKLLENKNVDFGGGFERILAVTQNTTDIFQTDLFLPIIQYLEKISAKKYNDNAQVKRSFRVIADHIRSAVMLGLDDVFPSNKEQGYFARRMLRRAIRFGKMIGINQLFIAELVPIVAEIYKQPYPELVAKQNQIKQQIEIEEKKFAKTLNKGLREFTRIIDSQSSVSGQDAFKLYETYGFPFEITQELAQEKGLDIDIAEFNQAKKAHASKSRTASAGKFKGGLADHSQQVTKYHTATHLLNQALREVLGNHVQQAGSNITGERLRFDFTHPEKLTTAQKQAVEDLVNQKIQEDLPVTSIEMDKEQALNSGAIGVFGEKYADKVTVYSIEDFSCEICGGPHVKHTGELDKFTLGKEKAIGQGKRRIYGYLQEK